MLQAAVAVCFLEQTFAPGKRVAQDSVEGGWKTQRDAWCTEQCWRCLGWGSRLAEGSSHAVLSEEAGILMLQADPGSLLTGGRRCLLLPGCSCLTWRVLVKEPVH